MVDLNADVAVVTSKVAAVKAYLVANYKQLLGAALLGAVLARLL